MMKFISIFLCARSRRGGRDHRADFAARACDCKNMSNPIVTFETTMGTLKAEIFLDRVPRTASNFIAPQLLSVSSEAPAAVVR